MSITSVSEAYYLVRIGSWSEEDLERWIQRRISDKVDEVSTEYYERILEKEEAKKYSYEETYGTYRTRWY